MVFYKEINSKTKEGKRTVERLLLLREKLKRDIPPKTQIENLLLATWNIREFDSVSYGQRLNEAIYYIAEIIDHFDLVALQEVNKDLTAFEKRLMPILGSNWDYIFTDTTKGTRGNQERLVFLWDKRKIRFGGLAGELVLPEVKINGITQKVQQLARTPFICGFKAGWTRFMLATVHILWGESSADPPERIQEIKQLAQFLKKRTEDEDAWARNLVLLGDFNIFKPNNKTFKELINAGFEIPSELLQLPANAKKNRHYDQIAFKVRENSLDKTGNAGVFDYYNVVFRYPEDENVYMEHMTNYETTLDGEPRSEKSKKNYYQSYWRTHQMSDHLPMWVELKIDYSDEYLKYKRSLAN